MTDSRPTAVAQQRIVRCPACGAFAKRDDSNPFVTVYTYPYPNWLHVVRCKNHGTSEAVKDEWREVRI